MLQRLSQVIAAISQVGAEAEIDDVLLEWHLRHRPFRSPGAWRHGSQASHRIGGRL
jgi:hypothetical protein